MRKVCTRVFVEIAPLAAMPKKSVNCDHLFMKTYTIAWAGHVVRMKETQIERIAFEENVEGYRLRGRPRSRWKDNIKKDVELMGINPEEWKQVALERGEWAAAVTQAYGR
ncbi:hypothetical protein M8J77_005687 [Diaphorina citri]|nr:hypothetical protein M8J77_005687 [Diaphorina citri]